VSAEAVALVAAKLLEAEFVAVAEDEDKMALVGYMAMQAAEDLNDLESLQRLTDRKGRVVAEVVVEPVVAVVACADPGDNHFPTPSRLVAGSCLTEFAHKQGQQQRFGPLQLWLHWLQQLMTVLDLAEDAVVKWARSVWVLILTIQLICARHR
jgi:hypothetical protein